MPTITINADYDGHAFFLSGTTYGRVDTDITARVGYYSILGIVSLYRMFMRFPLDLLPAGSIVSQVRVHLFCSVAGGVNGLWDIHLYNANGQANPQTDSDSDLFSRCAAGTAYIDDTTAFRVAGEYWFTMPAAVNALLEAAKSAVNRFSLGIHEEGDNDLYATLRTIEDAVTRVQLEITYTLPPYTGGTHWIDDDEG